MSEEKKFEQMYHLVGEQAIPIYLTAIQFSKDVKHILLTTSENKALVAANRVRVLLKKKGYCADVRILGNGATASSFDCMLEKIEAALDATEGKNVPSAFDLTGGTKPMSISALIISRNNGIQPCYLDFPRRQLYWFGRPNTELTQSLEFDDFIELNGLKRKKTNDSGICPSQELLDFMFKNATKFQNNQKKFADLLPGSSRKKKNFDAAEFQKNLSALEKDLAKAKLDSAWQEHWGKYTTLPDGSRMSPAEQARFLAGVWFEYYVYNRLNAQVRLKTILQNVEIVDDNGQLIQEFDVAYTDGFSFFIVECKAGSILQAYIAKLENLRSTFSGALGKAALVCLRKDQLKAQEPRIKNSRTIAAFCGKNGHEQLFNKLFDFETGKIYE